MAYAPIGYYKSEAFMKRKLVFSIFLFFLESTYAYTVIDSVGTGMALWTQQGHLISYGPSVDAILISNIGYSFPSGINVHSAPGDLSQWFHDLNVYNGQFGGPGRRINSLATTNPYISFPTAEEKMVAQRGAGWFSGIWENPANVGPADASWTGHVYAFCLPDSNILFVGLTVYDSIIYTKFTPDLQNKLASGTVARDCYLWGIDMNGGIVYIFYYDDGLNVYYRSTVDGINWSPEQTYNLVWPSPYPHSALCWTQMAITDLGNPLLVFDIINYDDLEYPFYGKVYVSYAQGMPCVEVSSTFAAPDTECFYPTIATGGNKAAVLYCMPRNNEPGGLNWWDFYVVWSSDNGATWGTPINVTHTLDRRPGLQQLAKRIDTLRNRVYFLYGIGKNVNEDPYWRVVMGLHTPMYICFDYAPYLGIEDGERLKVDGERVRLEVYPNPFKNRLDIRYWIQDTGYRIEKGLASIVIYDVSGRIIKQFNHLTIQPFSQVVWFGTDNYGRQLPPGVYFVVLKTNSFVTIKKVIKLK